jgi:xylan 1,4-beta-xylosidase
MEVKLMDNKRTYSNPVLRGFFPDPSVIRVEEDYYMVNSTFQYFPAVVISHSKDLVNWEIIGHAITENEYLDLSDIEDSHGIWAPDICYHEGTYYIFAPLRLNNPTENHKHPLRRQLVVKSDKPEGPYSKPVIIDVDTIDPSHFIDDDGSHYMVVPPNINLVKLNEDCTKALGKPVCVWPGTGRRAPEGPHLFKKDGYYYAILAEGGTGYGHCITSARSRNLFGPYEPSPYNPIMTQRDPEALIQRAGHGKLVQTHNGDWWVLYLCSRQNEGQYTTVGRETALDPVTWTEDGWFVINELKGPSSVQIAPKLPEVKYEEKFFDDFTEVKLGLNWQFVRNPDNSKWSLTERPGHFRIYTQEHDLCSKKAVNTLLRREKEHIYVASTKLEFSPSKCGEQAGITCYYGIRNYIKLFMTYEEGLKVKLVENRNSNINCVGEVSISSTTVYLKVSVNKQRREFYCSIDEKEWVLVGVINDCTFLCDEGVTEGKHHTGTLVGIYANNGGNGTEVKADFDWFNFQI